MPIDYCEDLMPRNAPKPAPVIEMEATPLVPEVSLLLDQDRNKSIHLNPSPSNNYVENKSIQKDGRKEVPYGNQFESYNTWKAKNAQLLSAITGSSGRPETVPRYSDIRQNHGIQRNHSNDREDNHTEEGKYIGSLPITRQVSCGNRTNKPELECSSGNRNGNQELVQKKDQQQIKPPNIPAYHSQLLNNFLQSGNNEIAHPHHQYNYPRTSVNEAQSCFSIPFNEHLSVNKEVQIPNVHFNPNHRFKRPQYMYFPGPPQMQFDNNGTGNPSNSNPSIQGQCHCEQDQCGVTSSNRMEYVKSQPCMSKNDRSKEMKDAQGKIVSPLDIAQVNNQVIIDLYHIINLQNEQIFMLQQQVKQVLQIHSDCGKNEGQNFNCHICPCARKNNCTSDKTSCGTVEKPNDIQRNTDKCSSNINTENYEKPKRSIGVMTNTIEQTEVIQGNIARQTENSLPKMKQKKKLHANQTASSNQVRQLNRRDLMNTKDGERKKSSPNIGKKSNQLENAAQVDNSFSLNEAELMIRSTSEQDDPSPNNSVHVDLQDYCSSSVESDSEGSASSSNEDERNSESGDDPTDPPVNWTFYNTVVGQVNKILKKPPTQPLPELPQTYRPPANHMFRLNTDYDTENNWSKRVTFDGPPLEDSDTNTPNMREFPKYNYQPMAHQDMRINDGRGRMQDFMMYNYANGNTNLSFATLRYLDRYHRLPSHRNPIPQDQMHHGYQKEHRSNKRNTKKKTRNHERYSDMFPQMSKRKSSTPSSKLLDITALKQQPKLF